MLTPPTAIHLSDGFGGLLKEIRVHETSLTRMDESSIFRLMTVLLFYSFIQRRFGVNKKKGFNKKALEEHCLVLKSLSIFASFLRNNCTQQEHENVLNVFHLAEFASNLILNTDSVRDKMTFACHFTLPPLYFCFLLKGPHQKLFTYTWHHKHQIQPDSISTYRCVGKTSARGERKAVEGQSLPSRLDAAKTPAGVHHMSRC